MTADQAVEMLIKCRAQFQMYGDLHVAKEPPQLEKARANYQLVAEINQLLTS